MKAAVVDSEDSRLDRAEKRTWACCLSFSVTASKLTRTFLITALSFLLLRFCFFLRIIGALVHEGGGSTAGNRWVWHVWYGCGDRVWMGMAYMV